MPWYTKCQVINNIFFTTSFFCRVYNRSVYIISVQSHNFFWKLLRTDFAGKRARYHDYSRELLKRVLLWSKLGTSLSFKICFFQIRKGRNGNTKGDSASKRKKK